MESVNAMGYVGLFSIFSALGLSIMTPIGGKLGDLIGRRNIVVIPGIICAVCGIAFAFVRSLVPLMVLRLLISLAQGAFTAAPYIITGLINERKKVPKAMGMLATSIAVGGFGGSILAGILTDMGIDGFWNDMNEPAIFYSVKGLNKALDKAASLKGQNLDLSKFFELKDTFAGLSNSPEDYSSIYHTVDGKQVCHDQVHNIYGANMTKAAGEYFAEEFGKEKILMFSRASYVGAHRSSGIWFGDNHSWWSHILLDLKMLPSANMCGFLYCGADLGGFNENATRDLVLRFLALGVFTPLMRNHAALGTRNQECYSFENSDDFKDIVEVRYRLIPYLYRTFKKASEENDMIFRPLSFDYPDDKIARECETQLMLGDECMICPVYEQNVGGRYVYLPENMTFVKLSGTSVTTEKMSKGTHYIEVALNEVPLFIKDGRQIELCKPAMRTSQLDTTDTVMIP